MVTTGIKRFATVALIAFMLALSSCSATTGDVATAEESSPESSTTAKIDSSPNSVADPTTSVAPTSEPAATERRPFGLRTLIPGPYLTNTMTPSLWFEIPEHDEDVRWSGRFETPWSVNMLLYSDGAEAGREPGLVVAVAEEGSTIESVVSAIESSDSQNRYTVETEPGLLAGQESVIVTRTSLLETDDTRKFTLEIKTGEESYYNTLYAVDRIERSYVMNKDDRVMIVTFEANATDSDMILAEAASIVATLSLEGGTS